MNKERNDNSKEFRGLHFQLAAALYYIAIKNYTQYNHIVIEHKGDVSFDNEIQIEVKHKSSSKTLSDNSEDFWNSLYNWCRSKEMFNKYILFTSANLPKKSSFENWISLSVNQKLERLKQIEKSNQKIEKYKNAIFASDNKKLTHILGNLVFDVGMGNLDKIQTTLSESSLFCTMIPNVNNRIKVIQEFIGYLFQGDFKHRWEFSHNEIDETLQSCIFKYPKEDDCLLVNLGRLKPSKRESEQYNNCRFVMELTEMNLSQIDILDNINDVWRTLTFLEKKLVLDHSYQTEIYVPFETCVDSKMRETKKVVNIRDKNIDRIDRSFLYYNEMQKVCFEGHTSFCEKHPYFRRGTMNNLIENKLNQHSWLYDK